MGRKQLWEKEKLLVTSNFSFSHSVFIRLVLQTRKNQGLFGKGLNQQFIEKTTLSSFNNHKKEAFENQKTQQQQQNYEGKKLKIVKRKRIKKLRTNIFSYTQDVPFPTLSNTYRHV